MLGVMAGIVGALILAATLNALMAAEKGPRGAVAQSFDDSPTGAVIRERFAADYDAALSKLAPDHALGLYERFDEASKIVDFIHARNSQYAGRANDAALRQVIEARISLLRYVSEKKDALACARLQKEGAEFMRPIPAHIGEKMDLIEAALMTAMANGRDNPVNRKAAYQEDWEALHITLVNGGLNQTQIDRFQADGVHEDDCRIAIAYYEALANLPGDAGERVRSYTIDSWALPAKS